MSHRHGLLPTVLPVLGLLLAVAAAPAFGTEWCGENGMVRFSFAAGPDLVEVLDTGESVNGVTTVDVTAWLTDVDPVHEDGEQFLRVGGYELELEITGAEAFLLKQEFPVKALNVGRKIGSIAAGMVPGQKIEDGRIVLATWQVMFQGRPENVRFGLKVGGTPSCPTVEGCPEAAPPAVYVGVESSKQLGKMFGAGYVPGWLNPTGDPDRQPVHAGPGYAEVGVFAAVD